MVGKKWQRPDVFTVISILTGLLILVPLAHIVIGLFHPVTPTWIHIRSFLLKEYVVNTLVLVAWVGVLSGLIGLFAAYMVNRYDFFGRRMLSWLLILPIAVPSYIAAYVYADMISHTGTFSRLLRSIGWGQPFEIMNMPGAIFIFVFTLYPYVYVAATSALVQQSASYEESAKLLGSNKMSIFFKVTLPLLRPALIAGILLVILETLNDFGVVSYFNVRVFSFAIFNAWFSLGDIQSAIRLSALLLLIVFVLIVFEKMVRGRRRYQIHVKTRPIARKPIKGFAGVLAVAALWLILTFGFLIPFGQLLWYLMLVYDKVVNPRLLAVILNSLTIASTATLIVVSLAVMLANFNRKQHHPLKKAWLKITNLGYAIPGAVIAVAVNIFFIGLDRRLYPLYQIINPETTRLVLSLSLSMLIFAYVLRFMAIGFNSIEASYDKIGHQFTEAAYVLKANRFKTLMKIDIPLLKPGLISAAIIVFIDVIKELPLTLILRPFNYDTLATLVYEHASDEMLQEASLASLVLIMISSVLIYVLTHQKKKEVVFHVR